MKDKKSTLALCITQSQYQAHVSFLNSLSKALTKEKLDNLLLNFTEDSPIDRISTCTAAFSCQSNISPKDILLPVFSWLLDHPVQLLPRWWISEHENFTQACCDRSHLDYLKEFYPGKSVLFPHAACPDLSPLIPWEKKDIDVLFIGSLYQHKEEPDKLPLYIKQLIEIASQEVLNKPNLPVHEVLDALLKDMAYDDKPSFFHYICRSIDLYKSHHLRMRVLQTLDDAKFPLITYGQSSLPFPFKNFSHRGPVSYQEGLNLQGRAKIVINISPMFPQGGHDRIFSSMLSGSAVITNESSFMEDDYKQGESILFYKWDQLQELPEFLYEALSNEKKLQDIAEKGRAITLDKHTWKQRLPLLKDFLISTH